MADISHILALIKITFFGVTILLTLIYFIPILFIRRFQHPVNLLTLNICLTTICTSIYWMVYFIMWEYYIEYLFTSMTCTFLFYIQTVSVCQVSFAFVMIAINRYCSILHSTKAFFKTKKFVAICVASQCIICCVLSVPFLTSIEPVNDFSELQITDDLLPKHESRNSMVELLDIDFYLHNLTNFESIDRFSFVLVLRSSTLAINIRSIYHHNNSDIDHSYYKSLYFQTCSFFISSNSTTK
jgi:hypothetical protein